MSKAHEGSSLPIKTCLPVDEHTTFLAHYDITDEENLHGIVPTTSIATLRPNEGKFGGGIAIEEGTTNLVVNPTFTTTSNWALSTNGTRVFTTDGYWGKITVPSGEVGRFYYLEQTRNITIPANQSVTWTVKFKNNVVGRVGIRLVMFSGASPVQQPQRNFDLDGSGGTITVSVTGTHTANVDRLRLDILTGSWYSGLTDTTIEFTEAQVEQKPFATSFVNGSRPTGRLAYEFDTNSWQNFTFMCWTKVSTDRAFRMLGGAWTKWYFSWANNSTNSLLVSWVEDGVQRVLSTPNILEVDCREWNMVGFTYDGTNIHIYMNGKLVRSGTGKFNSPSNSPLGIGTISGNSTSHVLNGIIDEVRIDKIVRTPEEIAQWYNSSSPFFPKGIHRVYL